MRLALIQVMKMISFTGHTVVWSNSANKELNSDKPDKKAAD